MKNNEELRKLIQENPDLPLVFNVYTDDIDTDYNCIVFESCHCRVETIYFYEDRCTNDDIEVLEYYMDFLSEEDEYKDLSDEDYEEAIKNYIEENIIHYKAIVVSVG